MAQTLLIAYALVAVATAVTAFAVSARLGDGRRPNGERIGLSLAAGAVWPVILLGLVELSSIAVYAKVHEHDDEKARVDVLV